MGTSSELWEPLSELWEPLFFVGIMGKNGKCPIGIMGNFPSELWEKMGNRDYGKKSFNNLCVKIRIGIWNFLELFGGVFFRAFRTSESELRTSLKSESENFGL
jgi:hypothetical protein